MQPSPAILLDEDARGVPRSAQSTAAAGPMPPRGGGAPRPPSSSRAPRSERPSRRPRSSATGRAAAVRALQPRVRVHLSKALAPELRAASSVDATAATAGVSTRPAPDGAPSGAWWRAPGTPLPASRGSLWRMVGRRCRCGGGPHGRLLEEWEEGAGRRPQTGPGLASGHNQEGIELTASTSTPRTSTSKAPKRERRPSVTRGATAPSASAEAMALWRTAWRTAPSRSQSNAPRTSTLNPRVTDRVVSHGDPQLRRGGSGMAFSSPLNSPPPPF
jgi:hypothetical protein